MQTTTPQSFTDLFDRNQVYKLPHEQRDYCWAQEEWGRYWKEAVKAWKTGQPYYMGVPHFKVHSNKETGGYVAIVDGQQRFLTTLVFLAVLRDAATGVPDTNKLLGMIGKLLFREDFAPDGTSITVPRIAGGLNDREALNAILNANRKGLLPAHQLSAAYGSFRDRVSVLLQHKSDAAKRSALEGLFDAVTNKFRYTPNCFDAAMWGASFFRTINQPGKVLTAVDHIHSLLIDTAETVAISNVEAFKAEQLYGLYTGIHHSYTIAKQALSIRGSNAQKAADMARLRFWRYKLIADAGAMLDDDGMQDFMQSQIQRLTNPDALQEYMATCHQQAAVLRGMLDPDLEPVALYQKTWRLLAFLKNVTVHALCFAIRWEAERHRIDPEEAAAITSTLVHVAWRRSLMGLDTRPFQPVANELLGVLQLPRERLANFHQVLRAANLTAPSDEAIQTAMQSRNMYDSASKNQETWGVFYNLERASAGKDGDVIVYRENRLEHALSQSLPADQLAEMGVTKEEAAATVHLLGNLAQTTKNSQLGNAPFAEKKPVYAASRLYWTRQLASYERIHPAVIRARTRLITSAFLKLLDVPAPLLSTDTAAATTASQTRKAIRDDDLRRNPGKRADRVYLVATGGANPIYVKTVVEGAKALIDHVSALVTTDAVQTVLMNNKSVARVTKAGEPHVPMRGWKPIAPDISLNGNMAISHTIKFCRELEALAKVPRGTYSIDKGVLATR